jgi:Immunity protein 53
MGCQREVQRHSEQLVSFSMLEKWYAARCNGKWEHHYGIRIDSLDDAGWKLQIDLEDTPADSRALNRTMIVRDETDWIHYWVEQKQFQARTGPRNLGEAIQIFVDWFEGSI